MSLSAKRMVTVILTATALMFVTVESPAQSVIDRIKQAAAEAAKRAEDAKKADDAKKAAEEASKRGATPAVPGGGNPNANSPNAATPAQPGGRGGPSNVPASSAKVEELSLASGQQLKFVVAPKGGHAAAVVLRGSRMVVVHDGVDGPRFDAVIGESDGLIFSPDGTRLAYLARVGTEYVFMVDGKELLRVPTASHPQISPNSQISIPQFTDNSKHLYFDLYTEAPGGSTGSGAHRLFVDGVPGPESFSPIAPIFAAYGDHHVYMVESRQKRGTYSLVLDGKPSPIAGGEPQMTTDGLHVFTKRPIPGPTPITELLLDGKPIMRTQGVMVYTTPIGSGFVTAVNQGGAGSGIQFLTMAAQRILGTDCPNSPGYSNVAFSPDAKHFVAVCQASASSFWVIVDGKKGQEYQGIAPVGFAADGRFVYGANMRNQTFLVTGDQESDGYTSMMSPITDVVGFKPLLNHTPMQPPATLVGNHIAFNAQTPTGGAMRTIVVDGKTLQREAAGPVAFSSDGSHFAFTFGRPPGRTLNFDGKDLPGDVFTFQAPSFWPNHRPRAEFVFSPDGKRVAYFAQQPGNASAVYLDGKPVVTFSGNPENLTFTPDGRHLLWLGRTGTGQTVYVDGRASVQFDGNFQMQASPGTWQMGADGTLTVVAQAGDAIKRFRITPGSDTSADTIGK